MQLKTDNSNLWAYTNFFIFKIPAMVLQAEKNKPSLDYQLQ